jgi:hypothetical protein
MSLVRNERIKLIANALDRASTACIAVGILAPIVTTLIHWGETNAGPNVIFLMLAGLGWLSIALALHLAAQRVLGKLR